MGHAPQQDAGKAAGLGQGAQGQAVKAPPVCPPTTTQCGRPWNLPILPTQRYHVVSESIPSHLGHGKPGRSVLGGLSYGQPGPMADWEVCPASAPAMSVVREEFAGE